MHTRSISTLLTIAIAALAWLGSPSPSVAAVPETLNYQGVLQDNSGSPVNSNLDMEFQFWSDLHVGAMILVDRHLAANAQAVPVISGLFNATLGTGEILDGAGPGTYTGLAAVFRDFDEVYLQVKIGTETLAPRTRVTAAGYAMNSKYFDGRSPEAFIDDSTATQAKAGQLTVGRPTAALSGVGIEAHGQTAAGYFVDTDGTGYAFIAEGDVGINAYGSRAGYFRAVGASAETIVAEGDVGLVGRGSTLGGRFEDTNSSAEAWLANGDDGVWGTGDLAGGYFFNNLGSGWAEIGALDSGIRSFGNAMGGYFKDANSTSYTEIANGNYGLKAYGTSIGASFDSLTHGSTATVASADYGIIARADDTGGYFEDLNDGSYARVGSGAYKITGSGAVSFRQNHPEQTDKEIVYFAPESSEVGVYTRGSSVLDDGTATISLDETFRHVTNPDLGLTAHLTARSAGADLHVVSISSTELVVGGTGATAFDYMVWGLRVGFEEMPPLLPKKQEAFLPAMLENRELYASKPALRQYNALERFSETEAKLRGVRSSELDRSAGLELEAKIGRFDAAVHGPNALVFADDPTRPVDDVSDLQRSEVAAGSVRPPSSPSMPVPMRARTDIGSDIGSGIDGDRVGTPAKWANEPLRLSVAESVEAGELISVDPLRPGFAHRSFAMSDPNVIGIAGSDAVETAEGQFEVALEANRYAEVKVDAGFGAIRPGSLLVASPTPGHAMRAVDAAQGAVVGKAIDALEQGTGTIRVLLLPQ